MLTAKKILEKTYAYGISTIDENGFPKTLILSSVMSRFGFATLYFYVTKESETVKNILKNPRGSISCYAELEMGRLTTLNLKGTFTLVELDEVEEVAEQAAAFNKKLNYTDPCVLLFETLSFEAEEIKKIR